LTKSQTPNHLPQQFGIDCTRERRGVNQIAKQHRDLTPLALPGGFGRGLRCGLAGSYGTFSNCFHQTAAIAQRNAELF
jgi:hypothetical protein